MLYVAIYCTRVPVTAAEAESLPGKGDYCTARTREVKIAVAFTQAATDEEGRPVRDPGSSSYVATFAPAAAFGTLMASEAHRRGASHIRQIVILGDGAAWIWYLACQHFPEATQVVDLFTPASTCTTSPGSPVIHALQRQGLLAGRPPG